MSTMTNNSMIREHMDVVCSLGMPVGKIDHIQGDQIKLTKNDSPDGKHHIIPMSMVASVDEVVHLTRPCDEVKTMWQTV